MNAVLLFVSAFFCWSEKVATGVSIPIDTIITQRNAASIGLVGDGTDVNRTTVGGTALVGGGKDVDEVFQWMIKKAGGGDFVVIRASGTDAYNSYIYSLGPINSV
ncbi:unnamed protein product, partial [Adineta steineri]